MDIFGVLSLIGGLALFLYGMNVMGDGLVKVSGGKLERVLETLTSNRLKALLLGAGVTAVIQSSSATTVMVVGFVNSGIMKLTQAVGIIMGANIGTTITSWMLSLTGIQSSNVFIKMLKPSSFSPILAAIGIVLIMATKGNDKKKDIGTILLGFAVLMTGMETMSSAVSPLADDPNFTGLLTAFSNPILGMVAGAVLTAIIQSSSASVGILQALCATGAVSFGSAIPIIMGQNIGTCVTAIISSIGANKNARRASMIHLYFNLIGTILFMCIFYAINAFAHFAFLTVAATPMGIAVIHSMFNIACAIVMFPFANYLVKLATLTIPDKGEKEEQDTRPSDLVALDERFLDQPSFAMELCKNAAYHMAEYSRDSFELAMHSLKEYSKEVIDKVIGLEELVDQYEDVLGSYLVQLSSRNLSRDDSQSLSVLLHCINDFERISDHAINVVESAQKMYEGGSVLTDKGMKELEVYSRAIRDIMEMSVKVFRNGDLNQAKYVEPMEELIDIMSDEMKKRHVDRLKNGKCTLEAGLILDDIITNFERVSDHCSNIAVCVIEVKEDEFETHGYVQKVLEEHGDWFEKEVLRLGKDYVLPDAN